MIRLLDEVLSIGEKGALLFAEREYPGLLAGCRIRDARGQLHAVARVEPQEELFTLLIEGTDSAYFERLFRDVRVDATAFELEE